MLCNWLLEGHCKTTDVSVMKSWQRCMLTLNQQLRRCQGCGSSQKIWQQSKKRSNIISDSILGNWMKPNWGNFPKSNLIVSDSIIIEFTVMSDFTRHPIGWTCNVPRATWVLWKFPILLRWIQWNSFPFKYLSGTILYISSFIVKFAVTAKMLILCLKMTFVVVFIKCI